MLRHQLPAWSPVSLVSVRGGLAARGDPGVLERLAGALSRELGSDRILLTASGTLALLLALRGARGGPGAGRTSERGDAVGGPIVALPAWGCYDLATAADGAGARVRLYDLDPRTLAPDPESLRFALAAGVEAVVIAHFFGLPVPTAEAAALASDRGALLVDDAAQAGGASLGGRPLGAGGDLGVLSFGRGKGRTGGRGGALLAFGAAGAAALARLDLPGWREQAGGIPEALKLAGQWLLGRPAVYGIPAAIPWLRLGETIYHPPPAVEPMTRFAAGVLLAGAAAVEQENQSRREAGGWWRRSLHDVPGLEQIRLPEGAVPGWLRYPVVVRDDLIPVLASRRFRRMGVMPGYPAPLAELPGFRERILAGGPAGWPGAELLARRLFTLPTHSRAPLADRVRLLAALRRAAGG